MLKINTSFLVKFKDFNTLCAFCNFLNISITSNLFYYNGFYYLSLQIHKISDFKKVFICLKEFTKDYKLNYFANENADLIVKNNAIEFCKKFI